MKKLALTAFILLILTGCTSNLPAETVTSTPTTPNQPVDRPNTTATTTTTEQTQLPVSNLDQVAYDGARALHDATYCDKIVDNELKQNCHDELSAVIPASLPAPDCTKISDQDQQKACQLQQEIKAKLAQQEQDAQNKLTSDQQVRDQAVQSLDSSKCQQISTDGIRKECQVNVILQKAQQQKNPAICDELDSIDQEVKPICLKSAA